jgi:serine/threonine protein kinase
LLLDGGWTVTERLDPPGGSGGCFSVQYRVTAADGQTAFLKALDISATINAAEDLVTALKRLTNDYDFERSIVQQCSEMSRVVRGLAYGQAKVPGSAVGAVPYLIFEFAEHGDIRRHLADTGRQVELAWKFETLHHIGLGLSQLHAKGIAHGDLKPSNVLVFPTVRKIGDMGCATQKGREGPRDHLRFAGDPVYPPLELLYGYQYRDWEEHRLGTDLYLYGSLAVFLIMQTATSAAILENLDESFYPLNWGETFDEVLPYLRNAFGNVIDNIRVIVADNEISSRLCPMIEELCNPDPRLRGLPRSFRARSRFSIDRYVSRLANLIPLARYRAKGPFRC